MANNHGGARPGAGRPKGTSSNKKFRELLELHGEEIIQIIIENALNGDRLALKQCFDRLLPALKAVEVSGSSEDNAAPLEIVVS